MLILPFPILRLTNQKQIGNFPNTPKLQCAAFFLLLSAKPVYEVFLDHIWKEIWVHLEEGISYFPWKVDAIFSKDKFQAGPHVWEPDLSYANSDIRKTFLLS